MKRKSCVCILSLFLLAVIRARAAPLPDSCGDDKVKFNVTTQKNHPVPAPSDSGKAQIIFLENENQMVGPFMYATVRFGMDGAWVGANHNNSYFTLMVDPGLHHLCANWQATLQKKTVDLTSFTAEPGKVYYFSAAVTVESKYATTFALTQLNEDEGKYRVKLSEFATSKSKK